MRKFATLGVLALLFLATNITASSNQQTQFYMNIGEYYNIENDVVLDISEQGIEDEDLAVVFKIASDAKVSHQEVVNKRLEGSRWINIASDYGLSARNFYVMITGKIESKHYVPIFAKYRVTPEAQWKMINLTDGDIRSLVNLKFVYSHYDYSPYQIMAMKDYGKNFVRISNQVEVAKADMIKRELAQKEQKQQVEQN